MPEETTNTTQPETPETPETTEPETPPDDEKDESEIKLPEEFTTIIPVAEGSGLWGLKTVYVCLIAAGIDTVFIALVTTLVFFICCRTTKAPTEKS